VRREVVGGANPAALTGMVGDTISMRRGVGHHEAHRDGTGVVSDGVAFVMRAMLLLGRLVRAPDRGRASGGRSPVGPRQGPTYRTRSERRLGAEAVPLSPAPACRPGDGLRRKTTGSEEAAELTASLPSATTAGPYGDKHRALQRYSELRAAGDAKRAGKARENSVDELIGTRKSSRKPFSCAG